MELPLASLRVLDLTEADAQYCGRYLADLGARVILVEPPGGSAGRRDPAVFGLRNANKASVLLDLASEAGRAELLRLAGTADIVLESFSHAQAERYRLTPDALRQAHPGLVVVSVTAFGRSGPYRDFAATGPVLAALGGVLSRSGQPGARPVLPPPGLIGQTAALHAAWAALIAYAQRLRTGTGEHADVPALEAVVHGFDPLIAALFADRAREDLVAEGAKRGIPVAGVLTPAEVLTARHFGEAGTLADAELAEGVRARVPSGYVRIDGVRAGLRRRAPRPGEHDEAAFGPRPEPPALDLGGSPGDGPLAGLRVLDLGVIVFGAELGRLLADQGADVIKVENPAFPDGLRQTLTGGAMNASFAWAQRNKRGLGLDLRGEPGRALFLDLVRQADVVLANFKPGTLESLGLSYAELSEVNPRIIVSDSSAFGSTGTWSGRLGYGPLVRASCGVSELWRDPDGAFCDGVTVYPDHVAAHVAAIAVLAAVIGRARSGRGTALEVAQADVAVMHLGPVLASLGAGDGGSPGETAWVLPCAGDDEWCVIDVRDKGDRTRLAALVEGTDLGRWTAVRRPDEVMAAVQAAGVPAGSMRRLPELLTDPHLAARQSFRTLSHPLLSGPVPANARAARFSTIGDPPLRPAPVPGQHTRQVAGTLLGLAPADIDRLVDKGVLQEGTE
jgi:crotonobetainyl-CoA:carnitine CoA-transferase CaiB-like acyl-CoA transferase